MELLPSATASAWEGRGARKTAICGRRVLFWATRVYNTSAAIQRCARPLCAILAAGRKFGYPGWVHMPLKRTRFAYIAFYTPNRINLSWTITTFVLGALKRQIRLFGVSGDISEKGVSKIGFLKIADAGQKTEMSNI